MKVAFELKIIPALRVAKTCDQVAKELSLYAPFLCRFLRTASIHGLVEEWKGYYRLSEYISDNFYTLDTVNFSMKKRQTIWLMLFSLCMHKIVSNCLRMH